MHDGTTHPVIFLFKNNKKHFRFTIFLSVDITRFLKGSRFKLHPYHQFFHTSTLNTYVVMRGLKIIWMLRNVKVARVQRIFIYRYTLIQICRCTNVQTCISTHV